MNIIIIGILLQASSGTFITEVPIILILAIIIIMGITIYNKRKNINNNEINLNNPKVDNEQNINNFKHENPNTSLGQTFFTVLTFILLICIGIYIFPKGSKEKAEVFAHSYIHGFLGDNEYIIDETIKCWDGTFCCKISKISSNDNNSLIPIPDLYQLRIGYDGEGYYLISMMAVTNNATGQGKAGFSNYNLIWPKIDLSR